MHFGVILPNFGRESTPTRIRAFAAAAEELGFHSVWTAEPHPSPQPEVWVGGSSDRAVRRAQELGDVWHPSRGSDPAHVRQVKQRHPDLRIVPRTSPERVDEMLEAGAEGAVVTFPDEAAMAEFARRLL